jgi:hypothetical protein
MAYQSRKLLVLSSSGLFERVVCMLGMASVSKYIYIYIYTYIYICIYIYIYMGSSVLFVPEVPV